MSVARYFDDDGLRPGAGSRYRGARLAASATTPRFGHFIDGAFVAPAAGAYSTRMRPGHRQACWRARQRQRGRCRCRGGGGAQGAGPWAKLGGHGAGAASLCAGARWCSAMRRLFAVLETLDNGKPIRETRDIDVPLVARHFYHHAGWAQLQEREFADQVPVGVVGQIIPWNFPLLMLAWKMAPALALGNTVVLKPAEFTSLTALLFAEICGAGGPAGRRAQYRDRRRRDRRSSGRASRRRQDRLHRLDRSRPPDPRGRRRARASR